MIKKYHDISIVVRTSMAINPYVKRPFNLKKEELLLKCLKSLLESCNLVKNRVKLYVVDDSGPENIRNKIRELLSLYKINSELIKIEVKSNKKSLEFSYNLLKKAKSDLLFLADDDYLYTKQAFSFILNAYDDRIIGTDQFAIYPFDEPTRYEKIYPSYIFLSKDSHWRSIGHSTGSIIIPKKLFIKNEKVFNRFVETLSEKGSINELWKEIPLISPIPSLVAHLNSDTIPPFVKWEKYL